MHSGTRVSHSVHTGLSPPAMGWSLAVPVKCHKNSSRNCSSAVTKNKQVWVSNKCRDSGFRAINLCPSQCEGKCSLNCGVFNITALALLIPLLITTTPCLPVLTCTCLLTSLPSQHCLGVLLEETVLLKAALFRARIFQNKPVPTLHHHSMHGFAKLFSLSLLPFCKTVKSLTC